MKAIVQDRYGAPGDVLKLEDIDKPVVKDDEVLVGIHAAAVHVSDWVFVRGVPYIMRPMTGLLRPKSSVPGEDIAGRVEAVGKKVRQLRPGDEVFGWCNGAFAEYACAGAGHSGAQAGQPHVRAGRGRWGVCRHRPPGSSRSRQGPGRAKGLDQRCVGGVGPFAVQIAKAFGADVTGVCSTRNVDMVRSIGADQVIDYTQEDFTKNGQRYDLILDNVGNHSLSDLRRVLTPGGFYNPTVEDTRAIAGSDLWEA